MPRVYVRLDPAIRFWRYVANPAHLFVGDQRTNLRDASAKRRVRNQNEAKSHCAHGHAFTPENTRETVRRYRDRAQSVAVHRTCRTCVRERQRRYTSQKSA